MKYWRIMPTNPQPAEMFESVWSYDLANNTIAVSWWQLGDVRGMSDEQFDAVCDKAYPDTTPNTRHYIRQAILRFHGAVENGVKVGDTVVACRGRSEIVGIGQVTGDSDYDEARGLERIGGWKQNRGPHFLPVSWTMKKRTPVPATLVLPRTTFSELPVERARAILALASAS